MKAYAYRETYIGGGSRYVLRFSLFDSVVHKTGAEVTHVDRSEFEKILEENRKSIKVITDCLPPRLKSVDTAAVEDSTTKVEVHRVFLDRAA